MASSQKTLTCACGKHSYDVDKEVKSVTCWECVNRNHAIYCKKLEEQVKMRRLRGIILDQE